MATDNYLCLKAVQRRRLVADAAYNVFASSHPRSCCVEATAAPRLVINIVCSILATRRSCDCEAALLYIGLANLFTLTGATTRESSMRAALYFCFGNNVLS